MANRLPPESFVIAVDAGGTHTRVGCFGMDGRTLSMTTGRGGSPTHNQDAAQNVSAAVTEALRAGGLDAANAVGLAAGMAGISRHRSNDWADDYYALPSLSCPRTIVNDAVIAHRGALTGEPGVIVVAGTGSMIMAIAEDGTEIQSGQFEHYAGGARHLVFDLMHRLLVGDTDAADTELISKILDHWQADDVTDLRRIILDLETQDPNDIKRRYGDLAPVVTADADTSPMADAALRALADKTARGVQVLAPLISREPVPVAVAGALARDPAFVSRLGAALPVNGATPTKIITSALEPLGGAALLAYEVGKIGPDQKLIDRLAETVASGR